MPAELENQETNLGDQLILKVKKTDESLSTIITTIIQNLKKSLRITMM
jgi:hypothetical protein